jgi:cell division protein FtsI (penicillin-binding protein 3)
MKDHNWRRGGYGDINVARALEVSSNIGVSHVIDKYYGKEPERYVKGLYRVGIHEDLKLPLVGYLPPRIRMPERNQRGQYTNWSKTALPWMSIGYETQIAPINTVTFYNAIANNGKMMRPRFVKKVMKNGETIAEYPPQVIKERIAKPQAIKTMQTILEHVVSQGLGRKAGSPLFKVAGKTGTAQVADQYGGYHSGITRYWLSFAGFFPADEPRYSCIVCIKKSGLPASGGGMSGVVFHHIAEGVMARYLKLSVDDAQDENSVIIPDVKIGNADASNIVLSQLGIDKREQHQKSPYNLAVAPDVTGMGARDAVYEMERRGVKVRLHGRGKVKRQSLPAGKTIAELESYAYDKAEAAGVDVISGATLADTLGYLKGIIAAANVAANIQTGHYTVYNQTGETVKELYIAHNATGEKGENLVGEGLANGESKLVLKSIPADADGSHALTFTYVTESGRTGEFTTLSIEDVPMTLLSADAMTGATPLNFFAPKAE